MYYIQRKDHTFKTLETVDEAYTYSEAKYLRGEYQLSDQSATYYISTRSCKDWKQQLNK